MNLLSRCLFVPVLFCLSVVANAADTAYQQTIDGVVIYIGIVPAEVVRGHPPEHPEGQMHGGVPFNENHLTVALFDAKSGRRISNAAVAARVTDDGGINVRRTLEPMLIADRPTFGNYFPMPSAGAYRIEIEVQVPGRAKAIIATFTRVQS